MESEYKDKMGRWLTESLFVETGRQDHLSPPPFCLLPSNETDTRPCLKRLYMELADPTEYRIATEVLGGWPHWQRLQKAGWFKPYIRDWRIELETKLISEGVQAQRKMAAKGNANAAKWLAEKGWSKRKAGAPSKEEVVRERKVAAKSEKEIEEHYNRVFN